MTIINQFRSAFFQPGSRSLSRSGKEALNGYSFISLWMIGFLVFQLGPLLAVFYFSMTSYDVFSPPEWVGFANYEKILTDDPLFWKSLANTLFIVLISVPVRMLLSFFIAILLNQRLRGIAIFRTVYYLPMIVPLAATAVLWSWMLHPRLGVVNFFLETAGLPSVTWLITETWSKPSIIIVTLWRIGEPIVLFLAGLQDVPQELYEAAEVDGAGWRHKLLNITVPLLTPTIFMLLVLEVIQFFQSFIWAFAMTDGGPLNSSLVYVLYIFRRAFENFRMGYASALAVVLFLIVLVFTVVLFRWSRYWVHTEVD